jgi:hypothetical protein
MRCAQKWGSGLKGYLGDFKVSLLIRMLLRLYVVGSRSISSTVCQFSHKQNKNLQIFEKISILTYFETML